MRSLIPWAVSAAIGLLHSTAQMWKTLRRPPTLDVTPEAPELPEPPKPIFIDVLAAFMKYDAAVNSLKTNTREKHQFQYNNILAFMLEAGMRDMRVDEIRIRHMDDLREWLHTNVKQPGGKPISVDHVSRHLRMCRNACDFAVRKEYINSNTIGAVETKRSPIKEVVSCQPPDIRKFERYYNEKIPQRNMICHYFLYQCFTGISYMDIWKHKVVEVFYRTKDDELKTRLMVSCPSGRGKNGRMYWAPFTRKAQIIYNMYGGEFPHVSLQTYNRSIKKIAIECGVDLYLTTHIGRKTFATLMGLEGFSEPAIAVMLGNTEEIVRKHYKNTSQGMLFNELDRLGIESPDSPDHNLSVA